MPGLLRGVARTAVVAGTATSVSNRVSRRQARRWSDQASDQTQEAVQEQPASQAPVSSDPMEQIQKLGDLHAQGILTDEEFSTKKQELLSQL